ncbi:MAG: hypothetical protein VW362_11615 [Candidatus Nanopelagicales bacterium]
MKLDRSKPFGKITGEPFIPEGCDRPAAYDQNGLLFDAHDRLIEKGKPASIVPHDDPDDVDGPDMTVADMIREANVMHWRRFKAMAMKVLGPDCPNSKAAIVEALIAVQKEFDARQARKVAEARPAKAIEPTPANGPKGVDLAAWARGTKEYLFGDIRKAIKEKYGRNVQERDDAVEFLVSQGVIYADHARTDVIRDPKGATN